MIQHTNWTDGDKRVSATLSMQVPLGAIWLARDFHSLPGCARRFRVCTQIRGASSLATTAHTTLLVSVGFLKDMCVPLVHLPQPRTLYAFLSPFPDTSIAQFALYSDPD